VPLLSNDSLPTKQLYSKYTNDIQEQVAENIVTAEYSAVSKSVITTIHFIVFTR